MLISSPSNERIKHARALRRRKQREATGLCYVEGIRATAEALDAGADFESVIIAPELLASQFGRSLVDRAADDGVPCLEVTPRVFRALSDRDGPQGLAAVVRQRWHVLEDLEAAPGSRWVALDGIGDPGNLGTILRTADASGAEGVILLGATADPYDPASVRASTGAVFTRRLVRADFRALLAWSRARGVRLVGSSAGEGEDYRRADFGDPTLLLLGSEREGLTAAQRVDCDTLVRIPMLGTASSLNLAVAAGVLLYRILDARERGSGDPR